MGERSKYKGGMTTSGIHPRRQTKNEGKREKTLEKRNDKREEKNSRKQGRTHTFPNDI
jgi:hypothetical protein